MTSQLKSQHSQRIYHGKLGLRKTLNPPEPMCVLLALTTKTICSTLTFLHKISAKLSVKLSSHPRQSFQKWIKLAESEPNVYQISHIWNWLNKLQALAVTATANLWPCDFFYIYASVISFLAIAITAIKSSKRLFFKPFFKVFIIEIFKMLYYIYFRF